MKISIIGCGSVGATTAYTLLLQGLVHDLTLIDREGARAEGIMLDLEHSLSFTAAAHLRASDKMSDCKNSDIVIITAGARQKEGETRLDLCSRNKAVFSEIIPQIAAAAPNAIIIVVTNPVDVLTFHTIKISGFPWQRVIGTGTLLDTARFQFHLSEKLNINPQSISAYVMGEHGDTSFPVLSSANVMGEPLSGINGFSEQVAQECYEATRTAAYRIIHDVGYTCYSIATAIGHIVRAITQDSKEVMVVSTQLNDYYGHSEVCLSLPCVIGKAGIIKQIEVPLNEEEKKKLQHSVETVKQCNNT